MSDGAGKTALPEGNDLTGDVVRDNLQPKDIYRMFLKQGQDDMK